MCGRLGRAPAGREAEARVGRAGKQSRRRASPTKLRTWRHHAPLELCGSFGTAGGRRRMVSGNPPPPPCAIPPLPFRRCHAKPALPRFVTPRLAACPTRYRPPRHPLLSVSLSFPRVLPSGPHPPTHHPPPTAPDSLDTTARSLNTQHSTLATPGTSTNSGPSPSLSSIRRFCC